MEIKFVKFAVETKLAKLAVLTIPVPLIPPGVNPTIVEA